MTEAIQNTSETQSSVDPAVAQRVGKYAIESPSPAVMAELHQEAIADDVRQTEVSQGFDFSTNEPRKPLGNRRSIVGKLAERYGEENVHVRPAFKVGGENAPGYRAIYVNRSGSEERKAA